MEDCRRCCGGHGVTLSSGIAHIVADFIAIRWVTPPSTISAGPHRLC